MRRTVVFVEKQTQSGQDLFIRGGVSQPSVSSVPISVRRLPDQWSLYNDWSTGDHSLDWDGAESGQGTHNGQEALGTPLGWTSSNPGNQFHHELNRWGDHYWIVDMDMDCSQTSDGWFEFETVFTNGGESGETDINQENCDGSAGGDDPVNSRYHAGRCGYMNIVHYNSNKCTIENIPNKL